MRSVGRGDMVAAQQIARIDEIDVFVGLHAVADLRFGGGLLLAFEFLDPGAEVAGFAPDGLQENQRRGGMRAADGIDESVETFVDDLGAGIRETVEDEEASASTRDRYDANSGCMVHCPLKPRLMQ